MRYKKTVDYEKEQKDLTTEENLEQRIITRGKWNDEDTDRRSAYTG